MPILVERPPPTNSILFRAGPQATSSCQPFRQRAHKVRVQPHALYIIAYEVTLLLGEHDTVTKRQDTIPGCPHRPGYVTTITWTLGFAETRDGLLCIPTVCPSKGLWRKGVWRMDLNQTGWKVLLVVRVAEPQSCPWPAIIPVLNDALNEQHRLVDERTGREDMRDARREAVRLVEALGGMTRIGESSLDEELEEWERTFRHRQDPVHVTIDLFL